ncbi:MAG: hypothetical protein SXV54_12710 [Chloroflexota bacterium]|nr:hypothetical protein [Chloroflexota bacterium]
MSRTIRSGCSLASRGASAPDARLYHLELGTAQDPTDGIAIGVVIIHVQDDNPG